MKRMKIKTQNQHSQNKQQNKAAVSRALGLSTALLASMGLMGMGLSTANAAPTGYNQLNFTTEVKEAVANDEVRASLYKKAQATDAKTLANELNTAINTAMQIAKRYPTVKVTTGQQSTYPQYDDDNKIIGWTGQANVDIKSEDFTATSQLIADLQESLVMDNLNFGVSDSKRDEVEKQLMVKASKAFKEQADLLTNTWGASGYRVVNVSLNTGNSYIPQPVSRYMAMDAKVGGVREQSFESGDSTISVTANGTIELAN